VTDEEDESLMALRDYVEWYGRYPIPARRSNALVRRCLGSTQTARCLGTVANRQAAAGASAEHAWPPLSPWRPTV